MFFSNLEIILEIKLKNVIISFFDISFNLLYIYIYVCVCIYTHTHKHHDLKKSKELFYFLFNVYIIQIINQ